MTAVPTVIHNAAASQFEARAEHGIATLKYVARGEVLDLTHTSVPQEDEGLGIGSALAHAALLYARKEGKKVTPSCAFVLAYLKRHKGFAGLVAPG